MFFQTFLSCFFARPYKFTSEKNLTVKINILTQKYLSWKYKIPALCTWEFCYKKLKCYVFTCSCVTRVVVMDWSAFFVEFDPWQRCLDKHTCHFIMGPSVVLRMIYNPDDRVVGKSIPAQHTQLAMNSQIRAVWKKKHSEFMTCIFCVHIHVFMGFRGCDKMKPCNKYIYIYMYKCACVCQVMGKGVIFGK